MIDNIKDDFGTNTSDTDTNKNENESNDEEAVNISCETTKICKRINVQRSIQTIKGGREMKSSL